MGYFIFTYIYPINWLYCRISEASMAFKSIFLFISPKAPGHRVVVVPKDLWATPWAPGQSQPTGNGSWRQATCRRTGSSEGVKGAMAEESKSEIDAEAEGPGCTAPARWQVQWMGKNCHCHSLEGKVQVWNDRGLWKNTWTKTYCARPSDGTIHLLDLGSCCLKIFVQCECPKSPYCGCDLFRDPRYTLQNHLSIQLLGTTPSERWFASSFPLHGLFYLAFAWVELEFQCPGRGRSHRLGITLVEGVGFLDFVALMTFQLMAMEET